MLARPLRGALLGALIFSVLACGGSEKRGSGTTPAPTPTPSVSPTPTPSASPTPSPTPVSPPTPTPTPVAPPPPGNPGTACAAATCASLGKNCGSVDDGCGGQLFCGNCVEGQVCGAGGGANVCGAPPASCTPTTCAAAGASCGSIPNGCGGTLSCGDCSGGQTCGGGGQANVCGAPPEPGGATRSVQWIGGPDAESVNRIRSDAAGNRYVFAQRQTVASGSTIILRKYAPGGAQQWEKTFAGDAGGYLSVSSFAVSGGGSIFLTFEIYCWPNQCTGVDFGGGKVQRGLVKLDANGTFEWHKGDVSPWGGVAADANGNVAVQRWDAQARLLAVDVYDFSGKLKWTETLNGARPLAFAPDGSLYLGWYSYQDGKAHLDRRDAGGKAIWTRVVATGPQALAVSARGTPVSLEWDQLAVYEPVDGAERFRVAVPMYGRDLAVQPGTSDTIRAVVVGQDSRGCNDMAVRAYDLAGQFLWSRLVGAQGSCGGAPEATSVTLKEDGTVWVGGAATAPADLGKGLYTPSGPSDAFLLELAP